MTPWWPGVTLNIFNRHCDRVRMANIAQTVNVLQAMILTDKAKILLTPTYHVFEMYSVHHDATLLPADLTCEDYRFGQQQIPAPQRLGLARQGGQDPRDALQPQPERFAPRSTASSKAAGPSRSPDAC